MSESAGIVVAIILVLICVGIPLTLAIGSYLLPTIVAIKRKKHDKARIIWLNVLLGWVGPVWIYTCVCAFLDNP